MKTIENEKYFYIGVYNTPKGAEHRRLEISRKDFYSQNAEYIDSKCRYDGEIIK